MFTRHFWSLGHLVSRQRRSLGEVCPLVSTPRCAYPGSILRWLLDPTNYRANGQIASCKDMDRGVHAGIVQVRTPNPRKKVGCFKERSEPVAKTPIQQTTENLWRTSNVVWDPMLAGMIRHKDDQVGSSFAPAVQYLLDNIGTEKILVLGSKIRGGASGLHRRSERRQVATLAEIFHRGNGWGSGNEPSRRHIA